MIISTRILLEYYIDAHCKKSSIIASQFVHVQMQCQKAHKLFAKIMIAQSTCTHIYIDTLNNDGNNDDV